MEPPRIEPPGLRSPAGVSSHLADHQLIVGALESVRRELDWHQKRIRALEVAFVPLILAIIALILRVFLAA